MTRERFEVLVERALATIPERFRDAMQNVSIVVEDEADPETLEEMGLGQDQTLLGLYQGTPLPDRSWGDGNRLPDRIVLYQRAIEAESDDAADTMVAIGETLIHELGHYFGLSEDEIEHIEDAYWHAQSEPEASTS